MNLLAAEWASTLFINDPHHIRLVRELASVHCLCEECFLLTVDDLGEITEASKNSALHWSRVFEWPWALKNGEIKPNTRCLDVGGGHAVFQYVAARCCQPESYYNIDSNERSLEASRRMANRLGLDNLITVDGKMPWPERESNYFDRVFCISVLEHCLNWKEVFFDMMRVLKPGGLLILTMDVNKSDEKTDEFFIGVKDALSLIYAVTGTPHDLPGGVDVLVRKMPDGAVLNCLCLKFRK